MQKDEAPVIDGGKSQLLRAEVNVYFRWLTYGLILL